MYKFAMKTREDAMLVLLGFLMYRKANRLQARIDALVNAQHTPDDTDQYPPCTLLGCTLTFNHGHCAKRRA